MSETTAALPSGAAPLTAEHDIAEKLEAAKLPASA